MASSILLVLSLLLPFVLTSEVLTFSNGNCSYYWTVYDETIPEDAVKGGVDSSGETFYVGLVHAKYLQVEVPGMIIPSIKKARVVIAGVTRDVRNSRSMDVKILRSSDKEAFKWIDTTSEDLHLLTDHHLVAGGKSLGIHLYIGKVRHSGGIVLGKVYPRSYLLKGLHVPSGFFYAKYSSYKVLAFECRDIKRSNEEDQDTEESTDENY